MQVKRQIRTKAKSNKTWENSTPPGAAPVPDIYAYRAQHLALGNRDVATDLGRARVTVDEAGSPLVWLARRRGRDGQALIAPHQLQAGERLLLILPAPI